jgi:hypothetical protein
MSISNNTPNKCRSRPDVKECIIKIYELNLGV